MRSECLDIHDVCQDAPSHDAAVLQLQCRVIFGSSGHKKRPKKGVLQVTADAIACWLLWCSYAGMGSDQRKHLLFVETCPCAVQSYTKCLNRTNGHAVHIKSIVNTDVVGTRHLCVGYNL